jgi:glycosyltransferase involved in cell wall biosynthesis
VAAVPAGTASADPDRDLSGLRFLFVAYYWSPYRSGLTLHAARVAEELAARGAEVTALCGRHDRSLPAEEMVRGVRVRRLRVLGRYDRGILVPGLVPATALAARRADAAILVLPVAEANALAAVVPASRLAVYYVCDPDIVGSRLGSALVAAVDASARTAVRRASLVSALSSDYARSSRVLAPFADRVAAIPPPVPFHRFAPPSDVPAPRGEPMRVGFLGRLVHEKGLDRLILAAARMDRRVRVVLAGDSAGVAGGGLADELSDLATRSGVELELIGPLPPGAEPGFYAGLHVFTLPSVSSLEAYGMVQVEAMLCGTPVVSSALPGVRELVERTEMGLVVPPGDVDALARALERVGTNRASFVRPRDEVIARLGLDSVLDRHAASLAGLARRAGQPTGRRRRWTRTAAANTSRDTG